MIAIGQLVAENGMSLRDGTIDVIQKGLVPRYLYKFRSPTEYTDLIIRNSALHYSRPQTFNDPFDCRLSLDFNNTRAEILHYLQRRRPKVPKEYIAKLLLTWSQDREAFKQRINGVLHRSLAEHGICCFAPDASSVLMWSHYTESHRGLCLKFDLLADPSAFSIPFKVEYHEEYPKWNHFTSAEGDTVTKMITSKAKAWEYEQEYRVLKFNDPGNCRFKKEALVEVIFGCQATVDYIAKIKGLVKAVKMDHVQFKQASISQDRFELVFNAV